MFEVRHVFVIRKKFTLDLDNKECSYIEWLISWIPYCHVIRAMEFLNVDQENYVPSWFRRYTYEETYASIIYHVNDHLLWERTTFWNVLPPFKRKLPGRPKKKRRLEHWELRRDETQITKGGNLEKCSISCIVGHNKNNFLLRP